MDMSEWIRRRAGRRVGHSEPQPDPEQAARIRGYLEAAGEAIPDYLQPALSGDWGGGPRGVPIRPSPDPNEWLREAIARKLGLRDA